jgi:hypothetical protein
MCYSFRNKNHLYAFKLSYGVTGTVSSSFDDAMWLPEWVNIEKVVKQ